MVSMDMVKIVIFPCLYHRKSEKKSNWSEEEQDQLRALYEEYKNCDDGKTVHAVNT